MTSIFDSVTLYLVDLWEYVYACYPRDVINHVDDFKGYLTDIRVFSERPLTLNEIRYIKKTLRDAFYISPDKIDVKVKGVGSVRCGND